METAQLAQLLTALLVIALGVLAVTILRRRGEKGLALAAGIAAVTMLPSPRDWGISLALVGTSIAGVAIAAWLRARGFVTSRTLRRARAVVLRAPAWKFDLAIGLGSTALYLLLGLALFDWIPVIQDSQDQLFHARIFLEGRVTVPPPPAPDFFAADNMILTEDRWYSQYPPGHSAVLALGLAIGAPWLVNPLLTAATLLVMRRLGRDAVREGVGRVAALLTLASPLVLYMSSEYMNHGTALFAATLVAWGTVRAVKSGNPAWALLAGAAGGWMALVRTFTAIAIVTPFAAWLTLEVARRRSPRHAAAWGAMMLGGLAIASLILLFNDASNGSPTRMGYAVCYPEFHMGFGPCPLSEYFTPTVAVWHSLSNLSALNLFFLGGPLPSLMLAIAGAIRLWHRPAIRVLAASIASMVGGYFFICWQDLTFGPRYLYETVLALSVLIAIGLPSVASSIVRELPRARRAHARTGIALALVAVGVLTFTPAIGAYYASAYSYRGGIVSIAEERIDERALVFVDGNYHRAFHAVTPRLDAPIVYVRDLGERNCEAARAFPDRAPWRAVGDTLSPYPEVCD